MTAHHPPDIYLESDSTRIVRDLHVATDPQSAPEIRIAQSTASITLGGQQNSYVVVHSEKRPEQSLLYSDNNEVGGLRLRDGTEVGTPDPKIELTADRGNSPVTIRNRSDEITTEFTTSDDGNGIEVSDNAGDLGVKMKSIEEFEAEAASGFLELYDDNEARTGALYGEESALVLDPNETGGDLVFRNLPKRDPDERDVSIHATADSESEYGLEDGIRPLVYLDGSSGTVELGRQEREDRVDSEGYSRRGEGSDGRITCNYYDTTAPSANPGAMPLLEAGIGWPPGKRMETTDVRCGEVVFRTAQGSLEDSGTLTSCGSEGLTVRDSGGSPALRVEDDGGIATAKPIVEEGLPITSIQVVPNLVDVNQGAVAEIEIDVGNVRTIDVHLGDEAVDNYALHATIDSISGERVTLQFDTAAAGDSETPTLTTAGEREIDQDAVTETELEEPLEPASYDVVVEFLDQSDTATVVVEELAPPVLDPDVVEVTQGNEASFSVEVGTAETLDVVVGDAEAVNYELRATIESIPESIVTLGFDTATAGDPEIPTLIPYSDVVIDPDTLTETELEEPLEPESYDLTVRTIGGSDAGVVLVLEGV